MLVMHCAQSDLISYVYSDMGKAFGVHSTSCMHVCVCVPIHCPARSFLLLSGQNSRSI